MRKAFLILLWVLIVTFSTIAMAAQKTITTYTWDSKLGVKVQQNVVSFENDIVDFSAAPSTTGAVTVDTTTNTIKLGNGINDSCGVLWYGGSNAIGNCNQGVCDFGTGFRTYFEFRFLNSDSSSDSTARGDGFTFTVMNGINNNITRRGGPRPGISMGELMCYAGSGNTTDEYGLRYPKFAIEFDTYKNTGNKYDGCSGGREDANSNNHVALMFWGDTSSQNCSPFSSIGNSYEKDSYDDNIHGYGSASNSQTKPANSESGDETGGYCQRLNGKVGSYNWMEDGATHRVRIEVKRDSNRQYNIKAWVDCEEACCSGTTCSSCSENEISVFQDLSAQYNNVSYLPKINRTILLTSNLHENYFHKMIFGFTEGTGGTTQNIEIKNFKIYFTP